MRQRRATINYFLQGLNVTPESIPEQSRSFRLTAQPRTELWRKSNGEDATSAPILITTLRFPFVSAEVTIEASWALEWDQAGLVIFTNMPPGPIIQRNDSGKQIMTGSPAPPTLLPPAQQGHPPPAYDSVQVNKPKWAKVGLEYNNGLCHASSVVATIDGADWSSTTIPPHQSCRGHLRVKMERLREALWLSYHDENAGWRKFREVSGFFCGVEDKAVCVGVYASRPAGFNVSASNGRAIEELNRELVVQFEDLVIF